MPDANRLPFPTLAALAHDIEQHPGFHTSHWEELRDRRPAFCSFLERRLPDLFEGNDENIKRALAAIVEAEDFEERQAVAGALSTILEAAPLPREFAHMSPAEQLLSLGDESTSAA